MGAEKNPAALISQIAAGSSDAFQVFYDQYAALVFTFALRLLKVRSDAEDLLQEVFLQVWHQAGSYSQDRGSPEAWLTTITRTRGIDKLRSIRRRGESFVAGESPSGVKYEGKVESGASVSEARITVNSTLARIPEAQRRVLELAYFDGMTQSEIAAQLAEPLGTIKTRMRAGMRSLRELLGDKETDKV